MAIVPVSIATFIAFAAAASAAGAPWVQLGPPDLAPPALSVAFDPLTPGTAYAGLAGGGVARSDDGGVTWHSASRGLKGGLNGIVVTALEESPNDHLFAIASSSYAPLQESTDGAATWGPVPLPPGDFGVSMAFDRFDPSTFYVAGNSGLYRTSDDGATWTRLQDPQVPYDSASAVAVDPLDRRLLYAGFPDGHLGSGLYVSRDGGKTWVRGAPQAPNAIVFSPADPRVVWAVHELDVAVSRDHGEHWAGSLFTGAYGRATLLADAVDADVAYVGAYTGAAGLHGAAVLKTIDGGRHWTPLNRGLPASFSVGGFAQDPFHLNTLLVATNQGVFRSLDRGDTWAPTAGIIETPVLALASASDGRLLAAGADGLWRSDPRRPGWTLVFPAPPVGYGQPVLEAVTVDPNDPRTVYLGVGVPSGMPAQVLWKSTNGGDSWTPSTVPGASEASDIAIDPHDSRIVYLASRGYSPATGGGIFRSMDGGVNWTQVLGINVWINTFELALDSSTTPSTIYAANRNVVKSTDGGSTWTVVLTPEAVGVDHIAYLVVAPSDPSVLYALADYPEPWVVFRSVDRGASWQAFSAPMLGSGFSPVYKHRIMAVNPRRADVLYVGNDHFGVATSVAGGPWSFLNRGLVASPVLTLGISGDGRDLLAGTLNAGAFSRSLVDKDH